MNTILYANVMYLTDVITYLTHIPINDDLVLQLSHNYIDMQIVINHFHMAVINTISHVFHAGFIFTLISHDTHQLIIWTAFGLKLECMIWMYVHN